MIATLPQLHSQHRARLTVMANCCCDYFGSLPGCSFLNLASSWSFVSL